MRARGGSVSSRRLFGLAVLVNLGVLYSPRGVSVPESVIGWDKLVHMALFAAVLWTGARAGVNQRMLAVALVINAFASELFQFYLLPARSGDVNDVIADLLGILGAGLLLRRKAAVEA